MSASKLQAFYQVIEDLQDKVSAHEGTCPACGEGRLRIQVLETGHLDYHCSTPGCGRGQIDAAMSAALRHSAAPRNGASANGKNGHTPITTTALRVREVVSAAPPQENGREKPWFTAEELMATKIQPTEWIVPGIIPEGLTVFAGRPKQGKSWGIYGVVIAITSGTPVMGKKRAKRGECLYMALEDGKDRLQERLQALLGDAPTPQGLCFATKWSKMAAPGKIVQPHEPEFVNDLNWWLDDHPTARMVVVDTLARIRPKVKSNGNVYEDDSAVMEALQAIAIDRRISLVVITHTRKPVQGRSPNEVFDEIQGSTGITGPVDAMLVLRKAPGEQSLSLFADGRAFRGPQEYAISWDPDTSAWTLLGDAAEHRRSDLQKELLNAVKDQGGPIHYRVVAAKLGKTTPPEVAVIKTNLWRLSQDDALVSTGEGFYAMPRQAS
jgi:hypothetical protein